MIVSDADSGRGAPVTHSHFYHPRENTCPNTNLQKLLAPAFGSAIRNVLVRCLQRRVRRCAEVISGQPNEGRLTTRCHVGLPPAVIGLDVLRQS